MLESQLSRFRITNSKLKERLIKLGSENARLRQRATLEKDKEEQEKALKRVHEEINEVKQEAQVMVQNYNKLVTKLALRETACIRLKQERANDIAREVAGLTEQLNKLQRRLDESKDAMMRRDEQLAERKITNQKLNGDLNQTQFSLSLLRDENRKLQQQCEKEEEHWKGVFSERIENLEESNENLKTMLNYAKKMNAKLVIKDPTELMAGNDDEKKDDGDEKEDEFPKATNYTSRVYSFDICLVFCLGTDEQKPAFLNKIRKTVNTLTKAGVQSTIFLSQQEDELYCLIGATEARLHLEAERIEYEIQFNSRQLLKYAVTQELKLAINATSTDTTDRKCKAEHWNTIYGKYQKELDEKSMKILRDRARLYVDIRDPLDTVLDEDSDSDDGLAQQDALDPYALGVYKRHTKGSSVVFQSMDRLSLLFSIMVCPRAFGGAGLNIEKFVETVDEPLAAVFPLHDKETLEELKKMWAGFCTSIKTAFDQPIMHIRNYFGCKIAFYFAFLGYYNTWLILPACVGPSIFLCEFLPGGKDISSFLRNWYAFLIVCWATLFVVFWERREKWFAVEMGQHNFELKEQDRPGFKGMQISGSIDGTTIKYSTTWKQKVRPMATYSSLILAFIIIGTILLEIIGLRTMIKHKYSKYIVSAITSGYIMLVDRMCPWVVKTLTVFENHQKVSSHENALILKTFIFKAFNYYSTIIWTGICKKYAAPEIRCNTSKECRDDMRLQLLTVFLCMIVTNNTMEYLTPIFIKKYNQWKEGSGVKKSRPKSTPEEEYELATYESPLEDYTELVIQFGFVSLFGVASPITPVLALFNNILEVWLDSSKLTMRTRRPIPQSAASIGHWVQILNLISLFAAITNVAISIFTLEEASAYTGTANLNPSASFLIVEHIVIALRMFLAWIVESYPRKVKNHLERQQYITNALLYGIVKKDKKEEDLKSIAVGSKIKKLDLSAIPRKLEARQSMLIWKS